MQLNDFMNAVDNKVIEGGESTYDFLPSGSRFIDAETKFGYATCYYEPVTSEVFIVMTSDLLDRGDDYLWIHPDYTVEFNKYAKQRKNEIPDAFPYTETQCEEDILVKVSAILNNRKFDPDVVVNFEVEFDVREKLEKMAFDRNITFDKLIEEAITKFVTMSEIDAKST